ncbi:lantibiotic dehydratase family protein [Flavobacterium sp. ANB]|uniref:lantibiotic dehydratase family protein n=1 Tax=unclassified Flavobacterium TaxID=196869 RepID=UPI0012BA3523|nr:MULTISPECIES: lantibiotic dehydratase family protein [unclassified Flavobacterium]MBF4519155.1 lantibiotic dehydratase family protein [Flavobacterium sp. ANB]MTD71645.1 hypothetical protein [Flavobacterium sp. LC2016-13]
MPKSEINLSFFSSFAVRTPCLSMGFYLNLTVGPEIQSELLKELLNDPHISESIYLASPEFFSELQKWLSISEYPAEKARKIQISLLKYLTRMSTRCTPFGLFSACGTGTFGNTTSITINKNSFYRKTRFDMEFMAGLGTAVQKKALPGNKLLFYPNTTLYKLGDFYRFIGYSMDSGNRKYSLEAVKQTEYLDLILKMSVSGISKMKLANYLCSDEINKTEALEFIDEIIESQILVSEMELTLTGDDFFFKPGLQERIKGSSADAGVFDAVKLLRLQLPEIDKAGNIPVSRYQNIAKTLREKQLPFTEKYLFQTDSFLKSDNFQLNQKYPAEIVRTIKFLNKISAIKTPTPLQNFKKAFLKRYEGQEVALTRVLDFETGIGYGSPNENFDVTPLLDSIGLKKKSNTGQVTELDEVQRVLHHKINNVLLNDQHSIELCEGDFNHIDFTHDSPSETFSCLFEIVKEKGKESIVIQHTGGSSAANLLARFSYGHSGIGNFTNEITKYESDHLADKIVAEIIHLPESRTGNVLKRPNFRPYEIPYLGQSGVGLHYQITIEDIILKMTTRRLCLWSKKHNREIIPRLTNAHNFSHNSLPVYQFLCDIQFENRKSSIGINTANMEKLFSFIPRITLGNCIVSKAKWIYSSEKNPDFFKNMSKNFKLYDQNISSFVSDLSSAVKFRPLPQYVMLLDADNTLLVNMQNVTCVEMLLASVKNRKNFILEEFLFPSEEMVNTKDDYFANQFIMAIKWDKEEQCDA